MAIQNRHMDIREKQVAKPSLVNSAARSPFRKEKLDCIWKEMVKIRRRGYCSAVPPCTHNSSSLSSSLYISGTTLIFSPEWTAIKTVGPIALLGRNLLFTLPFLFRRTGQIGFFEFRDNAAQGEKRQQIGDDHHTVE